ncbi:MAG: NADH-quinone oxidoreductase subunit NuoI [Syntrophobacterales bacterium]|nr:NADH-quinone oxidoreductase subunit NuoI [Syntrophobacterales bacterium]
MIIPLLKGLKLTLKVFFSKSVTIRYPEEKRAVSPRWRGMHYFEKNDQGETACVACGLCVAVCPSHCIKLEIREREDGTRYPGSYDIDALRCVFCGFCQEACPVNAIRLGGDYEFIHYSRADFKLTKESLLSAKRIG